MSRDALISDLDVHHFNKHRKSHTHQSVINDYVFLTMDMILLLRRDLNGNQVSLLESD